MWWRAPPTRSPTLPQSCWNKEQVSMRLWSTYNGSSLTRHNWWGSDLIWFINCIKGPHTHMRRHKIWWGLKHKKSQTIFHCGPHFPLWSPLAVSLLFVAQCLQNTSNPSLTRTLGAIMISSYIWCVPTNTTRRNGVKLACDILENHGGGVFLFWTQTNTKDVMTWLEATSVPWPREVAAVQSYILYIWLRRGSRAYVCP